MTGAAEHAVVSRLSRQQMAVRRHMCHEGDWQMRRNHRPLATEDTAGVSCPSVAMRCRLVTIQLLTPIAWQCGAVGGEGACAAYP